RLPERNQVATPEVLFKLSNDGTSFTSLWSKVDHVDQTLFIIRTTKGEVFGAYCSSSWAERNDSLERAKSKYFGTGESFVFRVNGGEWNDQVEIFGWASRDETNNRESQLFMAGGNRLIVIGSGGGDAIRVSEELSRGISSRCSTFNSPPLVEGREFDIDELEV
ncbi:hypothetical protein PENTCL1PPCAC_15943, partial [Pristionchus entomophagus]